MSTSVVLLALFSWNAVTLALTSCPHQCVCEDNNIVCSCDSIPFSKLVISSLGGAYVGSLTIHSCATVFVTDDSFGGVVLSERLSFIGINRLTFEPHAFRNILQSPKQLVIDKCTLPVILPNAFTGLSHMEHIWFRNSTIGRLSTHAFFHLTSVNYLYFRDVLFKYIERSAFGKMNSVGHLFMGGVVRIDSCESHLFVSSSIEEIVFEGLTGHLDAAFLLDADIRLINIRDSILEYETDDANRGIAVPQQTKSTSKRHNSAVFYNVSVNLLVPDLLAHFGHVTFFNSSITRVRPNQRSQVKYLRNDLIITFLSTNLRNIDSYAFSNISAHILNITNSVIGKINRFVASGATFEHIYITNTEVKVLDEQVFAHSQIKRFEVAGGQVDHILSSAFQFSRVEEMFIDSSRINILDKHAFNGSRIHTLSISKTTVNNVKSEPFDGSQITSLRISNCSFCGTPAREVFSGLTPNRLAVVNSTFDCNPSDCEMNAMLLKPSRHELFWYFENNKCRTQLIDDNKNVPMCVQHSVFLQSGLSCRLSWALADCVCTASTATLPKVNATVVVVGDCEHLSIADSEASPIALYLFRISKCDVLKVPSAIKTMKIYHSNAVLHQGAMANNQFTSLSLSHANIYKVARKAISNISVEELTVKDSFLSNWHMEAVTASWIKHATFTDSQIGDLRSLLQATAHLRIQNSVMFSGDGLPSMRSVHLNNNTVLCCCGNEGSNCENDLSMRQNCTRHFGSFTCSVGSMHGTILVIAAYFVYTVVFL